MLNFLEPIRDKSITSMKKTILLITVFLISTSLVSSQTRMTEQYKVVQNVVLRFFEAFSNRDSMTLVSCCTSDLLLFENERVWNLDTLIQAIKQSVPPDFKRMNTIDFIYTKINKNVAWTTYNNQAEVTKNGKQELIKWVETVVLIREGKTWKIHVLHSTLIKRT